MLSEQLLSNGYSVFAALDVDEVLALLADVRPRLSLLDLDGVGPQLISSVRSRSRAPMLVLGSQASEDRQVAALDAGADCFIAKPFAVDELLARMRSALRRFSLTEQDSPMVLCQDFVLDLSRKHAWRATTSSGTTSLEDEVRLTPTEWRLIERLVHDEGRTVAYADLLSLVERPGRRSSTNYLRTFVYQIRHKLEPDPASPRYFTTIMGEGFRFTPE